MKTEEQLAEQAALGDLAAFEELVGLYKRRVYSMALRMTGNPEDADDLSQEVFIRVYRSLGSFKGEAKFSTWLYRIVSNLCIDFSRRKNRAPTVPLTPLSEEDDAREGALPDRRFDPESALELSEMKAALSRAVLSLSPAHREIFLLREIQDLSYGEIGDILEIEAGTVKSRLARAREALKEALLKDRNFSSHFSSKKAEGREKL